MSIAMLAAPTRAYETVNDEDQPVIVLGLTDDEYSTSGDIFPAQWLVVGASGRAHFADFLSVRFPEKEL